MTVYYDIMFLINFTVDYLILYSTSKVGYINTNMLKMLLGAMVGGVYGIFVFEMGNTFNFFGNILTTVIIIYVSFGRVELKTLVIFYIISFVFGGISAFLYNMYGVVNVSGGFFYVDNNVGWIVFLVSVCTLFLIYILKNINRNLIKKRQIKSVEIVMEGNKTEVVGLLDTGNLLLDPVTSYPVILVRFDSIKSVLPDELKEFLKDGNDLSSQLNRRYLKRIRLIPVRNSGSGSILKGFRPDYIVIKDDENKVIKDVVVAVTHTALSENNEFNAILNPQL